MDSSLLDVFNPEAPELGPVPGDQVYNLTLVRLMKGQGKGDHEGQEFLSATIDFPDVPSAEEMYHFLGYIPDKEDPKAVARFNSTVSKFLRMFGVTDSATKMNIMRELVETGRSQTAVGLKATTTVQLQPRRDRQGVFTNALPLG